MIEVYQYNILCVHHASLAHYLPMLMAPRRNTIFLGSNLLQEVRNHKQKCKRRKNRGFSCRWYSVLFLSFSHGCGTTQAPVKDISLPKTAWR